MKYVKSRPSAEELKSLHLVVLTGVDEKLPSLKVMGWIEDAPHHEADQAVVLHEPLYFYESDIAKIGDKVAVSFAVQPMGIPYSIEFFEFAKVMVYEGNSPIGLFYAQSLVGSQSAPGARTYKPVMEGIFTTLKNPPQPRAQTQAPPPHHGATAGGGNQNMTVGGGRHA